jgi:CxxC-x17-CxxC domain-containing protein
MKRNSKHEDTSVTPQAEPDIAVLITKMQQQLVILEKKIDSLISQSSERPFKGEHYSKPFQRFDHFRRHEKRDQDNSYRERRFTQAICADCHKECEVPFKPDGDRPVYCREARLKENTIKGLAQKEILLKDSILIRSKAGRTRDMAEGNPFPAGEKNALNSPGAKNITK